MSDATLTVIVPTWNHAALLVKCLESLARQTRRPDAILVIDDGSTDDIRGAVTAFPLVKCIRLDTNRGFCKAINTGIAAATTSHVFLLNNDMTLDERCIECLMNAAETRPDTLLTPLILFADQPELIYAAGDSICANGRPMSIGFRSARATFALPRDIVGVTGGAALVPMEVFRRIGSFDERFVAYFEDADFCLRARLAGFDAALVPEAVVHHVGSASLGGKTWWRSKQCFRNHALLVLKNFSARYLIRHFSTVAREHLHQCGRVLASVRAEFGLIRAMVVLAQAYGELLALLPHALRERARIQRSISVPLEDILEKTA